MTSNTVLFNVASQQYFYTHRLELAKFYIKNNYKVFLITPPGNYNDIFKQNNINLIIINNIHRSSINIFSIFKNIFNYYKIYKQYKPDIIFNIALKPVLTGTIAGHFARVPKIINALGGMGFLFTEQKKLNLLQKFKKYISKLAIKLFLKLNIIWKAKFIVQNTDDYNILFKSGINKKLINIIPGMGINPEIYNNKNINFNCNNNKIKILFVSRMLKDKGILELIEAIKILILSKKYNNLEFNLYGDIDSQNPTSITKSDLLSWQEQNLINWHGYIDNKNLIKIYQENNIIILPSYREGFPKVLLEAASCGLAIIATDVPGCRELVINNQNGFLIQPYSSQDIVLYITKFIENPDLINKMGLTSRNLILDKFTEAKILPQFLKIINEN